jgi:peptide/nickel transport system ATP-binding protein
MARPPPVLEVIGVSKAFTSTPIFGSPTRSPVLRGVSLKVPPGGSVGLVGESGSGKSTLVRCILGLEKPDAGDIFFKGEPLNQQHKAASKKGQIQPIFQNPASSLNPRRTVWQIIAEPLVVHSRFSATERRMEVDRLLDLVGLPRAFAQRYPGQLSGGQCQRVSIARAVALRPALIIADEATSALDVIVQHQIVNLLLALRVEFGITMLFVSHNLAVTNIVCDEVAVMYKGEIVESGPANRVIGEPLSGYTRNLVNSVPVLAVPHTRENAQSQPAT